VPTYPDRRSRFKNAPPWEVGNIKDSLAAKRNSAPGEHFRATTAPQDLTPKPPEPEIPVNGIAQVSLFQGNQSGTPTGGAETGEVLSSQ